MRYLHFLPTTAGGISDAMKNDLTDIPIIAYTYIHSEIRL